MNNHDIAVPVVLRTHEIAIESLFLNFIRWWFI